MSFWIICMRFFWKFCFSSFSLSFLALSFSECPIKSLNAKYDLSQLIDYISVIDRSHALSVPCDLSGLQLSIIEAIELCLMSTIRLTKIMILSPLHWFESPRSQQSPYPNKASFLQSDWQTSKTIQARWRGVAKHLDIYMYTCTARDRKAPKALSKESPESCTKVLQK